MEIESGNGTNTHSSLATTDEGKYTIFANTIQRLSLVRTIDEVGDIVRGVARRLTGAQGATFVLRDEDKCYYADEDAIAPLWKGKKFPMETCISGWVMLNKTPAIIPDIYADGRIPHEAYRPTFVKSLVMVPIRQSDPLGAIGNYWSSQFLPDKETVLVLQALADITAVSIENIHIHDELEERVKERTQQLADSNQQLQRANSELETITYALSHDLKAPLRSMSYFLEKMMTFMPPDKDPKIGTYRDKLSAKLRSANTLIDELLTLFGTNTKTLTLEEVDMEMLATSVVQELYDTSETKPLIAIESIPSVKGDKILLKHVWSNLISNAIKYSANKPDSFIKVGAQEKHASIVYCVEDNGVGFDMGYADKLFQPFVRFHAKSEFEGAGIGLSIVQRIIERHGGNVWAKSEVKKGTTIFFELPKI